MGMWTWLLSGYAVLFLLVTGAAAGVALFVRDPVHRADGFRVLKLTLGASTGSAGLAALAVKLHEAGLL
ncbi:MAG TPA: hypothetical protein VG247_34745 [Pseudonocardiaceae bacterium]|jgi:hypothetical protein|nr:hypothetical protein [Pseudonocardiaceae bacterium]